MVLAGNFNAWNGAPCGYIVRLTTTGAVDSTFTSGAGADDRIRRLNWNTDGSGGAIYGYFRSYKGNTQGGFAVLDGNGNYIRPFSQPPQLRPFRHGLLPGDPKRRQDHRRRRLQRGGRQIPQQPGPAQSRRQPGYSFKGGVDGIVRSVAVQADGKILLAGQFGRCNTYARTSLARLNPDGTLDIAFNPRGGRWQLRTRCRPGGALVQWADDDRRGI